MNRATVLPPGWRLPLNTAALQRHQRSLRFFLLAICLLPFARAEQVKVRHRVGSAHGFLVLHNEAGAVIASGELTQLPVGSLIRQRVVFHFLDGSLDDETVLYSQRQTLRLVSDHLIQRGKSFPNPCDITIDVTRQQVRIRAMEHGKQVVKTEQMEIPPDLANGIAFTLVENLKIDDPRIEVPYLALSAKPRMVKLSIEREGEEPFKVSGRTYKAMKYDIKVNLGGLTGLVAPLIGKQPADNYVWVSESGLPAVVRVDGALYAEGPVWNIEPASPEW